MRSIRLEQVLWTLNSIFIGMTLTLCLMIYNRPPPAIRIVEVPRIVVKRVFVKVPVYLTSQDRTQIHCLAENAYYEAANQGDTGMIAVSNVVINRIRSGRFAKTPCNVIRQRTQDVCQFSWQCEPFRPIRSRKVFNKTIRVAQNVYLGNQPDITRGATFYHANYVNPQWAHSGTLRKTRQIGLHIFYRMR